MLTEKKKNFHKDTFATDCTIMMFFSTRKCIQKPKEKTKERRNFKSVSLWCIYCMKKKKKKTLLVPQFRGIPAATV